MDKMNTQTNDKRWNLNMAYSLLWKAALLLLAVSMIAAGPGPVSPGNNGASVASANCQSLLNSANCIYVETGIYLRGMASSSAYLPGCLQIANCASMWVYLTNDGVLPVVGNKLAGLMSFTAIPAQTPGLSQLYNWGIAPVQNTVETVSAPSPSGFDSTCQIQPYCSYFWTHNP